MVSTSDALTQRRPWEPIAATVAAAGVIGALAWIDPVFLPLILFGPLVTGAIAGRLGWRRRWIVAAWALGGLTMLVSDLVINQEDVAFHAAVAVVDGGLAALGWTLGRLGRGRTRAAP